MHRPILSFVAALLLAACGDSGQSTSDSAAADTTTQLPVATRPSCNEHRITGEGIGALRIGLPIDSVRILCNVTRDTITRASEGQMARVLSVAIDNDTVLAEVDSARVRRILVRSQELYTIDSLSVGSSIKMLTPLPDLNPMVGEGYLYVTSSAHCGMSFRLSEPPSSTAHGEWKSADLKALAPTVHVTRILLLGCTPWR
jgi:hypothetical protein